MTTTSRGNQPLPAGGWGSRTSLGALAVGALAATLAISGCGSDNNSTPASSNGSGGASAAGVSCPNGGGSLTASGSTAQQNAIAAWAKDFQATCHGTTINYGGGGSGKGVTDFTNGTTDFAGSDFPLTEQERTAASKRCDGGQAIDLPLVGGPIAVVYNLPGVTNLKLSAANLAKIFTGKITKWNDPAIAKDNPGVSLPSTTIQTFHRSDGSGTTYNFTNYLENVAKSDWTYGHDKAWNAPGGQGAKGSQGVAQGVSSTQGGIGYVEQSYAKGLGVADVGNAGGQFVPLTADNATSFLAKAKVSGQGRDLALNFDYTANGASDYPVDLVTYEIVCTTGNKNAALLKSFLGYGAKQGQDQLPDLGYVKLPQELAGRVQTAVANLG